MQRAVLTGTLLFLMLPAIRADERGKSDFVPLFNGRNLSGWVNVNCHPDTWYVKEDMIITTGKPVGFLRTDKMYENFILEFEWMHVPEKPDAVGNSGLFVWADPIPAQGQASFARAIEVQVLVNLTYKDKMGRVTASSHGDIFSIWGAKCTPDRPHPGGSERCIPSENNAKGANEWNHYRVEAKDGVIKLAVNGKVVSGVSKATPRKGYLALEAEGSECRFKNIKIKELPSSNPKTDEVAIEAGNWERLFNRKDLSGWKVEDGHKDHWKPVDWRIVYDGKSEAKDKNLWTEKEYADFEMVVDWKFTGKPVKKKVPRTLPSGLDADEMIEIDDAGDSGVYLRGNSKSQVNMWCRPIGSGEVYGYRMDKNMSPEVRKGVTPTERADKAIGQWNRFFITMKGDRLSVTLNGKRVLDNAQLPGVPAKGPIALQHHGDQVEFANLYIRELK
jgi:hypothetical protein